MRFFFFITGFVFSENEHTALEQFEGGPCAVIAPVQVGSSSILLGPNLNVKCLNVQHNLQTLSPDRPPKCSVGGAV